MRMGIVTDLSILFLGASLLIGCQLGDEVLVREPGHRNYGPPMPVTDSAKEMWQYAELSARVYDGSWAPSEDGVDKRGSTKNAPNPSSDASDDTAPSKCKSTSSDEQSFDLGEPWKNFPSQDLRDAAAGQGLYFEVWESDTTPKEVVVAFRGTDFTSLPDWKANLRWLTRFIPLYVDQYTLISERLGQEFVEKAADRGLVDRSEYAHSVKIIATGHSLGGGLAQHFAYSLPMESQDGFRIPRVSHVYAFDPSPVTGWYSVDRDTRSRNAKGLTIDRVFEHGEILAYPRLMLSYVYPHSKSDPAIRQVRFNFVNSANVFASHSMSDLASCLQRNA